MKIPHADKEVFAIIKDIQRQSDRGAAIVGSAFLEHYLELAVLSKMRQLPVKTHEILFEGTGPLGSFSAKIHVGFALSLYKEHSYADLRLINKIRNIFAHEPEQKTFATEEIASRCKVLNSKEYVFDDRNLDSRKRARKDFQNAIFFYMIILKGMADQPSVAANSETLGSSAPLPLPSKSRKRPHPPGPRRDESGTIS